MVEQTETKLSLWERAKLAVSIGSKIIRGSDNELKGDPVFPRGSGGLGFGPGGWGTRFSFGGSNIDYTGDTYPLWNSSLVMAVVNFVGTLLTEAPPQVREANKKGELGTIVDHPLTKLLNNPNPYTTGDALMLAFALDWFIAGNVYWLKERDPNNYNQVVRLWPLPAFMVRPRWDPADRTSFITSYRYTVDGFWTEYLPEDIVHFKRGMDPDNVRLGLGAFRSVLREIYGDNMASNFSAVILKNWGVLPFVISPKKGTKSGDEDDIFAGLTEDQLAAKAAAIKQSFVDATTGDKRGEPLVQTIPVDVTKLGFNPQELDISKLRNVPESRIAAVTNIPAAVLQFIIGLQNGTSYASYDAAMRQAYYMAVMPIMKIAATTIINSLLPEFGSAKGNRLEFQFDFSKVQALQEDRDKLYERGINALKEGGITLNMFRQSIGKALEDVDVIYVPRTSLPMTLESFRLISADPTALQRAMPAEQALSGGGGPGTALPPEKVPPKKALTNGHEHNGNGHRVGSIAQLDQYLGDLETQMKEFATDPPLKEVVKQNGNGKRVNIGYQLRGVDGIPQDAVVQITVNRPDGNGGANK